MRGRADEVHALAVLHGVGCKSATHGISGDTRIVGQVRRVKSRMVRLSTRVETLKEVLQKYLDDDSDMKDLNLSAKCVAELANQRF